MKKYADLLHAEGDFFSMNSPVRRQKGNDCDFENAVSLDEDCGDSEEGMMPLRTSKERASEE